MHNHGLLFTDFLKARRESFIVERNWDLPETEGMEFDQYDTPESRWVAIHEGRQILGGFRLTPTIARCGMYSYMIRDAQRGLLDSIPQNILHEEAPVEEHVYEISRFFKASHLSARARTQVQMQLLKALMDSGKSLGVRSVIALGAPNWERWMRRFKLNVEQAGPVVLIEGKPNSCMIAHLPGAVH
jgi:N-acyl-L-homoserine lactone synthetase